MKVLVTGAKGFVGKNLVTALECVRDGKDRREKFQPLLPLEIFEYDIDSDPGDLDAYCSEAEFICNLAGVNRPKKASEFMEGNFGFASTLLAALEKHGNKAPVMLSSSAQASLEGRYAGSEYGKSNTPSERALTFLFIVCLTCMANGVGRTTTPRLLRSAATLPTTFLSRSTILPSSLSCCISMIWLRHLWEIS